MDSRELKSISKKLSFALRHHPEAFNLNLDAQGWCSVDDLIKKFNKQGTGLTESLLKKVVAENDKKRFSFNESGTYIRANQGHSIKVELGYEPIYPPEFLYHGTAVKNLKSIQKLGLQKRSRHHVHLSSDRITARQVGSRHGTPVVLKIQSAEMADAGYIFYLSANGVWLTDEVIPRYIDFPETTIS